MQDKQSLNIDENTKQMFDTMIKNTIKDFKNSHNLSAENYLTFGNLHNDNAIVQAIEKPVDDFPKAEIISTQVNPIKRDIEIEKIDLSNNLQLKEFNLIDLESFETELNSNIENAMVAMEVSQKQLHTTAINIISNRYQKLSKLYDSLMETNALTTNEKISFQMNTPDITSFRLEPTEFVEIIYRKISNNLEAGLGEIDKQITNLETRLQQAESKFKLQSSIMEKIGIYKQQRETLTQTKETEEKLKKYIM